MLNEKSTSPHLQVGNYKLSPLSTGQFGLDGGAMFGTVPKVLWEKNHPADADNRIQMDARCLLLESQNQKILIDTGNGADFVAKYGDKLGSKFAQIYGIKADDPDAPSGLIQALKKKQIEPDDITHVILTHLHFDHAGGATTYKNGQLEPTFKKARYFVQKRNWENAMHPNIRERASYLKANFVPLKESGQLEFLDGSGPLLPGIDVIVSDGHTQGQQIVKIFDDVKSVYYAADLIPTRSHVRLAWIMGYDIDPLLLIDEKQSLLKEAARQEAFIFLEHDPDFAFIKVGEKNEDFYFITDLT